MPLSYCGRQAEAGSGDTLTVFHYFCLWQANHLFMDYLKLSQIGTRQFNTPTYGVIGLVSDVTLTPISVVVATGWPDVVSVKWCHRIALYHFQCESQAVKDHDGCSGADHRHWSTLQWKRVMVKGHWATGERLDYILASTSVALENGKRWLIFTEMAIDGHSGVCGFDQVEKAA